MLFQLALVPRALALDPAKSMFQYNCQTWDRQTGLPTDSINSIAQTKDGFIWLGSQQGLLRFDGLNFLSVPIDIPTGRPQEVSSLFPGADGRLLIGVQNTGFRSYDGQTFATIGEEAWSQPDPVIGAIFAAEDGNVWMGGLIGLRCQAPGKPVEILNNLFVNCICQDTRGQIWFGVADKGVYHLKDGKFEALPDISLKNKTIATITADKENRIWVGTSSDLYCYDLDGNPQPVPSLGCGMKALLMDRHGTLWIGTTGKGLARYRDGAFTFLTKADGLGSDHITSLFEDKEGSIWVGTQSGLSQLTDLKFPIYSSHEGFIDSFSHALAASQRGGLWVATSSGFSFLNGATIKNFTDNSLFENPYTKLVFEARNGMIYTLDASKNISIMAGGHLVKRIPNNDWPTAFAEDDASVLTCGGKDVALIRIIDGKLVPYQYKTNQAPPYFWIYNLYVSRDKAIWVASNNGIFRVKDGTYQHWSASEGKVRARANYIVEDEDGVIWAGLSSGLARIKNGQVKLITRSDGLEDNRIFAIVPDDYGSFWIMSSSGILRLSRQNLNDFADGKSNRVACETFDGLESIKTNDRNEQEFSGCKTSDGRVWFSTPVGVAMINPTNYFTNAVPPPVCIHNLLVNGAAITNRTSLLLNQNTARIEIRFSALSFIAPKKIKIRYQLAGWDPAWIDATGARVAFYSNLKPGQYTFEVQACNADGVWNTNGAHLSLTCPAPFYQTATFRILSGLGALLAVLGLYRWNLRYIELRQRQLQSDKNLLEAKVANRTKELAEANAALRDEIAERTRTEQKIQQALQEKSQSLSLLNATLEATTDGIAVFDRAGKLVLSNQQLHAMWRFPVELLQLGSRMDLARWEAQLVNHSEEYLRQIEVRSSQMEKEAVDPITLKDGRIFERWVMPHLIGRDCIGQVILYRDITERMRAEAELEYERDLLGSLLDKSPDYIYFKDAQSRFIAASQAVANQVGAASANDLTGKTDFDFFEEERARPSFEDEQEVMRTGKPLIGKIEKGSWIEHHKESWVLTSKMPLRNKEGAIIGTFGISKDITEIKENEAKLKEVHKQLLETSRQAGMAEVATSVLHNIGNVLNSVNVSASVVIDKARNSKLPYLAKVVTMLNEHITDLGSFMTTDPKGQRVPKYLAQLSDQLLGEQQGAITELELLRKNIEHIRDIVAMQQSYAKISGISEVVKVADVLEDAVRMDASAMASHEIELVREYHDLPQIILEKHKVLQILVNLIRNAKHACNDAGRKPKQIKIQLAQTADRVRIAVIDSGVGIPAENLTRIFNHGFTTRTGGHGFGLHNGALAAKELGGSLTAQSEGPGKGATFILDLPIQLAKAVP